MLLRDATEGFLSYLETIECSHRTVQGYGEDLGMFVRFLEKVWNCPIEMKDIRTQDLESFFLFLKKKGNKAVSRKRTLAAIRSFYRWSVRNDIVLVNLGEKIESIKVVSQERNFLTEKEAMEFIEGVEHRLGRLVVATLYYSGMRMSECLGLRECDVKLEKRVINVMGKGSKQRLLPICTALHTLLTDYCDHWKVPSESFFATKKTGKLSAVTVGRIIRETKSRLGWKKIVTAHVLRHSFASNLITNNVNIVSVSKLLGHASLKTTSIYTHVNMDNLALAVDTLGKPQTEKDD